MGEGKIDPWNTSSGVFTHSTKQIFQKKKKIAIFFCPVFSPTFPPLFSAPHTYIRIVPAMNGTCSVPGAFHGRSVGARHESVDGVLQDAGGVLAASRKRKLEEAEQLRRADEEDLFGDSEGDDDDATPTPTPTAHLEEDATPDTYAALLPADMTDFTSDAPARKKPRKAKPDNLSLEQAVFKTPQHIGREVAILLQRYNETTGLLELGDDREVCDVAFRAILKQCWGFEDFRPGQLAVVRAVLCGEAALCILPTGAGKSLCYQFAMLIFLCCSPRTPRFCIVISPLLSLMTDQVQNLPSFLSGVQISSSSGTEQHMKSFEKLTSGRMHIAFISPERAADSKNFHTFLQRVSDERQCAFVCVDEAHCMSEWSHNFRPSYLRLRSAFFDKYNLGATLCLTGTSTRKTTTYLQGLLKISDANVVTDSAQRTNLKLKATILDQSSTLDERDRDNQWLGEVARVLLAAPFDEGSVIVYVGTQIQAELVADFLRQRGVSVISYHAGVLGRTGRQRDFISGKVRVMVATVAFGMGVNKADVRGVVHLRLPPSIESYVQEIGRAGRDGLDSHCTIILKDDDYFHTRNTPYRTVLSSADLLKIVNCVLRPDGAILNHDDAAAAATLRAKEAENAAFASRGGGAVLLKQLLTPSSTKPKAKQRPAFTQKSVFASETTSAPQEQIFFRTHNTTTTLPPPTTIHDDTQFPASRSYMIKVDKEATALACDPEVVETVVTLLFLMYPTVVTPIGNLMGQVSVFIPERATSEGGAAGFTLLGDTWVSEEPIEAEVAKRFFVQKAGIASGDAVAFQRQNNATTRRVTQTTPLQIDVFELARSLQVDPRVVIDRLDELKREKSWKVQFRDSGIGFQLCGLEEMKRGACADTEVVAKALYEHMAGLRAAEVEKVKATYSFVRRLADDAGFCAHGAIETYLKENSAEPTSLFNALLAAPQPKSATIRAVPMEALRKAIEEDPIALGVNPLYTARICQGTLNHNCGVSGHKLWKLFHDHDFEWLVKIITEISADLE